MVVVGSGPAGVSAAESFRQHNPDDPIRIITDDPALPYARPPLSKEFLRGDAESADTELHPAVWFDERSIELVQAVGVETIDVAGRQLTADGKHYPYRWLVLACGAKPSPFPVPGGEAALQLRSLADAQLLREAAVKAGSAVVIGAGFIGCEAAASLAMRGVTTTLVAPDQLPQAKRLGEQTPASASNVCWATPECVMPGRCRSTASPREPPARRWNDHRMRSRRRRDRRRTSVSVGLRCWYQTSDGRIVVDAHMRTSVENVYAAGDVALAYNSLAGRPVAVEHWQDAVDQGEIAGAAAAGQTREWDAVPGFWTTIGEATLKYHAWGDGFDRARFVDHGGGFTVWYERDHATVGVLTLNADKDYDRGQELIQRKSPIPL